MYIALIVLGIIMFVVSSGFCSYHIYKGMKEPMGTVTPYVALMAICFLVSFGCIIGANYYKEYSASFEEETNKITNIKQTDTTYELYLDNGNTISISKKQNKIEVADSDYVVAYWNEQNKYKDSTVYMTQETINNLSTVEEEPNKTDGMYIGAGALMFLLALGVFFIISRDF